MQTNPHHPHHCEWHPEQCQPEKPPTEIPEPSPAVLFTLALAALVALAWVKRRAR